MTIGFRQPILMAALGVVKGAITVGLEYRADEVSKLLESRGKTGPGGLDIAVDLLDSLVTAPTFAGFLIVRGLRYLD